VPVLRGKAIDMPAMRSIRSWKVVILSTLREKVTR
jgi:hypothetical protein